MKIRRLNEKVELEKDFRYEIRFVEPNGGWIFIDPWNFDDDIFGDFDWDGEIGPLTTGDGRDLKNLKIFAKIVEFLNKKSGNYKLYKIQTEEIPLSDIHIILTTDKYNI